MASFPSNPRTFYTANSRPSAVSGQFLVAKPADKSTVWIGFFGSNFSRRAGRACVKFNRTSASLSSRIPESAASWDCVGFSTFPTHLFQGSFPRLLYCCRIFFSFKQGFGSHETRQENISDLVVDGIIPLRPAFLHQTALESKNSGELALCGSTVCFRWRPKCRSRRVQDPMASDFLDLTTRTPWRQVVDS